MKKEKTFDIFVGEDLLKEDALFQFKFENLSELEKNQLQKICESRNIEFLIRTSDKVQNQTANVKAGDSLAEE